MIMLYRRRTNNLKNFLSPKNSVTILFVILLILIGTIDSRIISKPLQSIALSFSLLKNNIDNGVSDIFSLFVSKEKLSEENRNLNRQYSALSVLCTSSISGLKTKQNDLEKSL